MLFRELYGRYAFSVSLTLGGFGSSFEFRAYFPPFLRGTSPQSRRHCAASGCDPSLVLACHKKERSEINGPETSSSQKRQKNTKFKLRRDSTTVRERAGILRVLATQVHDQII